MLINKSSLLIAALKLYLIGLMSLKNLLFNLLNAPLILEIIHKNKFNHIQQFTIFYNNAPIKLVRRDQLDKPLMTNIANFSKVAFDSSKEKIFNKTVENLDIKNFQRLTFKEPGLRRPIAIKHCKFSFEEAFCVGTKTFKLNHGFFDKVLDGYLLDGRERIRYFNSSLLFNIIKLLNKSKYYDNVFVGLGYLAGQIKTLNNPELDKQTDKFNGLNISKAISGSYLLWDTLSKQKKVFDSFDMKDQISNNLLKESLFDPYDEIFVIGPRHLSKGAFRNSNKKLKYLGSYDSGIVENHEFIQLILLSKLIDQGAFKRKSLILCQGGIFAALLCLTIASLDKLNNITFIDLGRSLDMFTVKDKGYLTAFDHETFNPAIQPIYFENVDNCQCMACK